MKNCLSKIIKLEHRRRNKKEKCNSDQSNKDATLLNKVESLYEQSFNKKIAYKNNFYLQRGPYEIISVMDESVNNDPYTIKGKLIDLFDPALHVIDQKQINPGEQGFLYNIENVTNPQTPRVLASASRIYDEKISKRKYAFIAKSPINTTNVMRILMPAEPKKITATDANGKAVSNVTKSWDALGKTSFLSFENSPDGINVQLEW